MDPVERIAEALLYEGYVLWPYRRSARKNQQRWTFGGVYPRGFCDTARAGDRWRIKTQCLLLGATPVVEVELRFLHLVARRPARITPEGDVEYVDELATGEQQRILAWDEAVERRVPATGTVHIAAGESREPVADGAMILRSWESLEAILHTDLEPVAPGVSRLTATLENTSQWSGVDRDAAQRRSFLSAHLVLRARGAEFVSATDPPADLASYSCTNDGLWPVLVGSETDAERSTMLASSIILSDYPQIAPESPTLLFDSGEIDQLLLLNTLSLTDAEKAEMRATDPRARAILERAESLTAQDVSQLHGAIRDFRVLRETAPPRLLHEAAAGPSGVMELHESAGLLDLERPTPTAVFINGSSVQPGSRVRLHPRQSADLFDLALAGRVATVESIEQDYDERVHLAVTVLDDPGADLGAMRMPGHRFFFSPEEVEPLT